MELSDFTKKYKISKATPTDITPHVFHVFDFSSTVKDFFETKFSGLVSVESEIGTNIACIRICEESLSMVFKLLLRSLYGNDLLNLKIVSDYSELRILATAKDGIKMDEGDLLELIRATKNSGFEISRISGGFSFCTEILTSKEFTVRAVSGAREFILAKLSKIFFGK